MFMKVNGVTLFYQIYGKGDPLLFIHGNMQDHQAFKALIHFFQKKYQVIAVDSRGHGRSEAGKEPLSFTLMAEDMLQLLSKLGIERYRVVGYSDGGIIALEMGISAPNRQIASVIIGAHYDVAQLSFFSRAVTYFGYFLTFFPALISKTFRRIKKRVALTIYHPHIKEANLAQVKAPLLAIIGDRDIISEADTKKLVTSVQRGKMIVLKRATHLTIRQKPKQLMRLITRFFQLSTD